jgi:hypothetical protein
MDTNDFSLFIRASNSRCCSGSELRRSGSLVVPSASMRSSASRLGHPAAWQSCSAGSAPDLSLSRFHASRRSASQGPSRVGMTTSARSDLTSAPGLRAFRAGVGALMSTRTWQWARSFEPWCCATEERSPCGRCSR